MKNKALKLISIVLLCSAQASHAAEHKTTLVISEHFEENFASIGFDKAVNPRINNSTPLSGGGSMSLGLQGWGAFSTLHDPAWDSGFVANKIDSTLKVKVDSAASARDLQFCTYVYFQKGDPVISCDSQNTAIDTLLEFNNTIVLDEEREIDRIFVRLKNAGNGLVELTTDSLDVLATQNVISNTPEPEHNAIVVIKEDFENNLDKLYFDHFTSAALTTQSPLSGASSLTGTLKDWGSLATVFDPPWDSGTFASSVKATMKIKPQRQTSSGQLEFCVFVYFQAMPSINSCDTASQLTTETKVFSVDMALDSAAQIDRIYVRLKNSGAGSINLLADDVVVSMVKNSNELPVPDEDPTTPPDAPTVPDNEPEPTIDGQIVYNEQFEQNINNANFSNVVSSALNTNNPIYGSGSLSATVKGWGSISNTYDPAWDSGTYASSVGAKAKVRVDELSTDADLEFCLFVYFQTGAPANVCDVKDISLGELPTFNVNVGVSENLQVDRVYLRLKVIGSGSVGLTMDNVQMGIVGITPQVPGPTPGTDPDPTPNPDTDPNPNPEPPVEPIPVPTNPPTLPGNDPDVDPEPPVEPDPVPTTPPSPLNGLKVYLNEQVLAELKSSMTRGDAAATRFKSMVDYHLSSQRVYGFQEWNAALLYQITNDARYCNYAVAKVDAFVSNEEQLMQSTNGTPHIAYDHYLEAGAIIADVALVRDWCADFLTPTMITRWSSYADSSVFNIWNPTLANWNGRPARHNGWSVDNPFNNYYYSFLEATMLTALAFEDDNIVKGDWRRMFRVTKVGNQLIPAFRDVLVGGGSREGTGYGTSLRSLYRLFDWWYQSTGEKFTDFTNHAKESSYYFLHALVPTMNYLVPFADQSRDSTAAFFDYHRQLLMETATLYKDENIAGVIKYQLENSSVTQMRYGYNYVYDYVYANHEVEEKQPSILADSYYSSGTGALFSRSDWSESATQFSTTIGELTESHDHRDKGAFNLYKTDWLAYDQVVNSHSGLLNMEWAHNMVRIQDLSTGKDYSTTWDAGAPKIFGLKNNSDWLWVAIDTKPVFDHYALTQPLSENRREMIFIKKGVLIVLDKVVDNATHNTRKIWQLNTPYLPVLNNGKYVMQGGAAVLNMYPVLPEVVNANIINYEGMNDMRGQYRDSSGQLTKGHRLEIVQDDKASTFLNVLDTNNLVASVTHSKNLETTILQINFLNGESYTIEFYNSAKGGSIRKNSEQKIDLNAGVESWPAEIQ